MSFAETYALREAAGQETLSSYSMKYQMKVDCLSDADDWRMTDFRDGMICVSQSDVLGLPEVFGMAMEPCYMHRSQLRVAHPRQFRPLSRRCR
jgi:hypothetical protein